MYALAKLGELVREADDYLALLSPSDQLLELTNPVYLDLVVRARNTRPLLGRAQERLAAAEIAERALMASGETDDVKVFAARLRCTTWQVRIETLEGALSNPRLIKALLTLKVVRRHEKQRHDSLREQQSKARHPQHRKQLSVVR